MKNFPFVSIIIPTWRENKVLKQCVDSLLRLDYPVNSVEIILLSKEKLQLAPSARIRQVLIGDKVNYVHARNIGVERTRGELIAFVDDDALTPVDWLKKAVRYFDNSETALIGGPAVPFPQDTLIYRVGGYLLASPFTVGALSARYSFSTQAFETQGQHLIMANNIFRRSAFEDIGGLHIDQAPCEDGYFYFRLNQKGYRMMYAPETYVWHRAKPVVWPIVSKVAYYGLGRGGLIARDPRSIRVMYLIPTLFFLALITITPLAFFIHQFKYLLFGLLAAYAVVNFLNMLYILGKFERGFRVALFVFFTTPILHISYGFGLLYGIYKYLRGGFSSGGVPMWSKH